MPIQAASAVTSALPSLPTLPTGAGGGATAGAAERGGSFDNMVVGAMENLQSAHDTADVLAAQAATGDLADAHDYMIAATQASLATELTTAVRNRAVESFQSIMSMQV